MSEEIYLLEIENIKFEEKFKPEVYTCSEGHATQGYGTKLPLTQYEQGKVKNLKKWTKEESEFLLEYRLRIASRAIRSAKPIVEKLDETRQRVIFHMCYQMGVPGVVLFKLMWKALEAGNYAIAADEMKDSKWFYQTPARAKRLINRMLDGLN
ncbi:MAG: glycoside hydrolase family protein [Endomicrobium sp.]|jgi:lysozyme|nr:glycoside hydrolase family protein [Endomicrobium sp.]